MNAVILIVILAVTVEALVEYVKTILTLDKKTIALQMSALAVSLLLCLATGADLYTLLGVSFVYPIIGVILTGVFASRGANFVSDLIGKLQNITSR